MPTLAIALLLTSAALHTLWNLLLKQASDKYGASWAALVIGGIFSLPILLIIGLPPRELWPFALASATLEAAYFMFLMYSYHDNDFSTAYPIARGAAPAFLILWAVLFLHEELTAGGIFGVGMIITGLLIISLSGMLRKGATPNFKGIAAALVTAVMISAYTTVDGIAVKRGPATAYGFAMFSLIPVILAPLILRRYGWSHLFGVWSAQKVRLSWVGVLSVIAYLIALIAYSFAPVSYSGSIREVTVVFGAFAGWKFLGERLGSIRLAGAAIIFGGILVIAILG